VIALAALHACQKDSDVFTPNSPTTIIDSNWIVSPGAASPITLLKAALRPPMYQDSFEVNVNPATVNSASGLRCTFPGLCCINPTTGTQYLGRIMVDMMLVKTKGDMIRADKPTISDGRMLVSGGEMFVQLSSGGQQLVLAPGKTIGLRYNESPTTSQMKYFYGDESNPNQFNWVRSDSTDSVFAGPGVYEVLSRRLRWINVDYFFDTTGVNMTKVEASLPSYYTNANTVVYLVFNNLKTVLGMYGTPATRVFRSASVPVGQPVTVVVISKQGDDYYLGYRSTTTQASGSSPNLAVVSPTVTTIDNIKAYLATL
jgi:hypothetical protein